MPVGLDYSRPTLLRCGEEVSYRKEIDNHWKYDSYSSLRTLFTLEKLNESREETIELEDAYEPLKIGESNSRWKNGFGLSIEFGQTRFYSK